VSTSFTDLFPIRKEWSIIDSSKLTTYMECPRKYFYSHLLGWKPREPNVHLVFGTAWHLACEHLAKSDYSEESIEESQYIFFYHYRKYFDSSRDRDNEPKDAANGISSLATYQKKFKSDLLNFKLLGTEIAGVVLIGPNQPMAFRIDALLEERNYSLGGVNQVIVMDHKTTQRKMLWWKDQWKMSTQILLYIYAAQCYQGDVKGARIRGAFFYKARPTEFDEAPVYRTENQMEAWLASTRAHYELLMSDMRILLNEDKVEEEVMDSFPCNEKSCFLYGRMCEFFDYCSADQWANPLQKCSRVPQEFNVEWWDPLNDPTIEHKVDLTGVSTDTKS